MGLFSNSNKTINWTPFIRESQLEELLSESEQKPVLIFKHSTRCSISSFALKNFEMDWEQNWDCTCYFLDLLEYRNISNLLAEKLHVIHQSPQVILIINREVVHHASHQSISAEKISSYF